MSRTKQGTMTLNKTLGKALLEAGFKVIMVSSFLKLPSNIGVP